MFSWVVNNLGFLRNVPLLPHLFDALLRLYSACTNWSLYSRMDDIEAELLGWEGVSTGSHKYGGLQFNYQHKEIGHMHGNGLIDILYDKNTAGLLVKYGRAERHHIFPDSGWISFRLRNAGQVEQVVWLFRKAYSIRKRQIG